MAANEELVARASELQLGAQLLRVLVGDGARLLVERQDTLRRGAQEEQAGGGGRGEPLLSTVRQKASRVASHVARGTAV